MPNHDNPPITDEKQLPNSVGAHTATTSYVDADAKIYGQRLDDHDLIAIYIYSRSGTKTVALSPDQWDMVQAVVAATAELGSVTA